MIYNYKTMIAKLVSALILATSVMFAGLAVADDWPTGNVNVILHTKPGGGTDVYIRTLAKELEPIIGQKVVVINAPGGGGATQMNKVRSAKPDGLTLAVNTVTHVTSMLTNLKGTFSLDDFSWIALSQVDPIVFFVRSDSKFNSLKDLVEAAKKNKGQINIGGFGPIGSMQSIGTAMLEDVAGVKFNWVAHKSTPDIMTGLLGGHVDVGIASLGPIVQYFESNRVKGLGVLGPKRLGTLPNVQTFDEQGYDVDEGWAQVRGVFGPKGIPMETQKKIADAIYKAMATDSYQQYARKAGVEDGDLTPEQYTKFMYNLKSTAEMQLTKAGLIK